MNRVAAALLALLGAGGCGGATATSPAPHTSAPAASAAPSSTVASIWFHPMPPPSLGGPPSIAGSSDFLALFQTDAPWQRALAQTSVVGFYAGWVSQTSAEALGETIAFLNAHNLGIELEAPALQATAACGSGVEGYVAPSQTVHDVTVDYLARLKALNANVEFIKVDEPFFYGSVVPDPNSCHFTTAQVATQVAQYAQLVATYYPQAQVGDVEPVIGKAYVPDVVSAMHSWHETYRAVHGAPFPFFIADLDYGDSRWPTFAKSLETQTREEGSRFGIIYIGDPEDTSDAQWTSKLVARFTTYEGTNGGRPDYALFQSWEQHPWKCLPETDSTTFTGALDAYITAAFR